MLAIISDDLFSRVSQVINRTEKSTFFKVSNMKERHIKNPPPRNPDVDFIIYSIQTLNRETKYQQVAFSHSVFIL